MTTEPQSDNPSTSKAQNLPSLRYPATDQEIIVELSRLSIQMAHQGNPTKQDIALKLAAMCDDLRGKTIEEIRDGCRRYRRNPESVFFPTPGQLLDACRNPYEDHGPRRHYDPLPELPPLSACVSHLRAQEILALSGLVREMEPSLVAIKEEILSRPRIQPEPIPLPPGRRDELWDHLSKTLALKGLKVEGLP